MKITMGAPNNDVTADILSSVGANILLAKRSLTRQKMAPEKKDAGIRIMGLEDLSVSLIKKGTAIPMKDTGPAKAVTQEDKILESTIIKILQTLTFTPTLFA